MARDTVRKSAPSEGSTGAAAGAYREDELPRLFDGGNFVVTVGLAGSGKSTFQDTLTRYLIEGRGDLIVRPFELKKGSERGEKELTRWKERWRTGRLLAPNELGAPKEYAYDIKPGKKSRYKDPYKFSFFEVSGEDLKKVVREADGTAPELPADFLEVFRAPKARRVVVFVADGDNITNSDPSRVTDDRLFVDFLQYLEKRLLDKDLSRAKKSSLFILLVSKPQRAKDLLSAYTLNGRPLKGGLAARAIRVALRNTVKELETTWDTKPYKLTFNIGELKDEVEDGVPIKRWATPDYRDIAMLCDLMYEHFTGRSPKGGVLHFLGSLFS